LSLDPTIRKQHSRGAARYQRDLTDPEWRLNVMRRPLAARRTFACLIDTRDRQWSFFVLRGGIVWRLLPWNSRRGGRPFTGSPPFATVRVRDDNPFPGDGYRRRIGCDDFPTAIINGASRRSAN